MPFPDPVHDPRPVALLARAIRDLTDVRNVFRSDALLGLDALLALATRDDAMAQRVLGRLTAAGAMAQPGGTP